MKLRRALFLVSLLGLLVAWFSGCSLAGQASSSDGAGGASSATASASTGTVSSTTTTVAATTGAGGGFADRLGAACEADIDCGSTLVCVKASEDDAIFGGGPAGGLCTRVCDADIDCPGTSSLCLRADAGQPGRCALTCKLGPKLESLQQPLDPNKCRGREDLRCGKIKGSLTACLPSCGSDSQCGPGRVCDPRLAVCVNKPSAGLPTGATCDPMLDPPECAGVCIHFQFGETMCSSNCALGGVGIESNDCGGATQGLCAFSPSDNGAGDFGFCSPSCDTQSACNNPGFWCFSVQGYTEPLGNGYCFGATPCPGGQGDCIDADKHPLPWTCTSTAFGDYCLDSTFPLGDAGTSTGTGGAGGGIGAGGGMGSGGGAAGGPP